MTRNFRTSDVGVECDINVDCPASRSASWGSDDLYF